MIFLLWKKICIVFLLTEKWSFPLQTNRSCFVVLSPIKCRLPVTVGNIFMVIPRIRLSRPSDWECNLIATNCDYLYIWVAIAVATTVVILILGLNESRWLPCLRLKNTRQDTLQHGWLAHVEALLCWDVVAALCCNMRQQATSHTEQIALFSSRRGFANRWKLLKVKKNTYLSQIQ